MKIALLGDIAFYGKYCLRQNSNVKQYLSEVSELLKGYDYVIGNLETPFATDFKTYGAKSAYIKSDPVNVELLNYLNISIVNLANNHIYDYGEDGYLLTKAILEENNIKYFGIENRKLLIQDSEGKIALHGYCCYSTNPVGVYDGKRYGVNPLNIPKVEEELAKNHENGYYNIVSIHCGEEHVNYPNYNHVKMARQFAEICPYTFYGHHPHVMQGIEEVKSSVIAYSLGNFCFDDVYTNKAKEPLVRQSENNKTSFILELEFENNFLKSYKTIPIYADKSSLVIGSENILDNLKSYSRKLNEDQEDYQKLRHSLLSEYIMSRKSMRDFNWYIKRLNLQSFLMIKASRENFKKFRSNVLNYLR